VNSNFQPQAWPRLLAALLSIAAAAWSQSAFFQAVVASAMLGFLGWMQLAAPAWKFLTRIWFPLAIMLLIVWGVIVRAPANETAGSNPEGGWHYGAVIALRLAAMAMIFQALLLPLRGLALAAFLGRLGLPAAAVAGICSIMELWPSFAARADRVVAARCARGLMPDRALWTRIKQLRFAIRTLFLGALSQSLERAERWEAEGLPQRLMQTALRQEPSGTVSGSVLWIVVSIIITGGAFFGEVIR